MRFAIRRIACSNKLRTVRPLPKCRSRSWCSSVRPSISFARVAVGQLVVILLAQPAENPGELERRIVIELEDAIESRRQPRIRLQQRVHFVRITGQNHDQPVAIILRPLQQRLHRFVAIRLLAFARHQAVRFVDEQHAVERLVDLRLRLRTRLAHILRHQAGAVGFDEMPLLQNPHRAEDLAEDPGDGRLARPRIAREHHVQAHFGVAPAQPRRGAAAASSSSRACGLPA